MTDELATDVIDLTTDDCWARLDEATVGRVAMAVDDDIEIFPVNFVVDDRGLLFRTASGTKLAGVLAGGRVALEIDGYDAWTGTAWSVVAKGVAHEVHRIEDHLQALSLPLFPWIVAPMPHFVRLEPTQLTGRSFTAAVHHAPSPGRVPPTSR